MTVTAFAEMAGYSLNHVSQIELGKTNGGPRFLKKAANILDCEIADITDGNLPRRSSMSETAPA